MTAPRRCAYVRCRLPLRAGAPLNALYCDSVCSARQRAQRDRAGRDPAPHTLSSATIAQRGRAAHVRKPLVWIRVPVPASVMAEARAEYDRQLAAVPKRAGRPKGGKGAA